ncbi:hypothetical protein TRVA0_078S00100 [Trichomonascus vanleenenianus]|uniref:CFEM domain-containing protein n=1 Tax=Trichomonascus vanleenenianus TaxID=2268995 RepID=UPI003ECB5234
MKVSTVVLTTSIAGVLAGNPYSTYPSVRHTASINGFADPIYDKLPECAKPCVKESTSNTPCPYWDPGCLCYMPQWGSIVAECIADNCHGKDVSSASSLGHSLCLAVGATDWILSPSASTALSTAANDVPITTNAVQAKRAQQTPAITQFI